MLCQQTYYLCEQLFLQVVFYEDISEPTDGIPVRNLIAGFHAAKLGKSTAINYFGCCCLMRQIIEILQYVQM